MRLIGHVILSLVTLALQLLCSIVLASGDQMDEDLKGLNDSAKNAGNPGRGPMWMRDRSGEWFRLKPPRRMIARTISKASTNQTNDQPTNWTNQSIKPTIDQLRPIDQVIENNGLASPATLAIAETNREAIDWTITITANIADGIGWGLELVRGLNQGLEVQNRLGTRSKPRRPWRFRRFKRMIWEDKEQSNSW